MRAAGCSRLRQKEWRYCSRAASDHPGPRLGMIGCRPSDCYGIATIDAQQGDGRKAEHDIMKKVSPR